MSHSAFWLMRAAVAAPLLAEISIGLRLPVEKGNPWVYGALVNNVWSLSSSKRGGAYSTGLIQPFVNYNFPDGMYLTSAPIATVDWKGDSSQKWTVPLDGGIGKIFHLGKLSVNTQISTYYNVVHPDNGANSQVRFQVQLMFPGWLRRGSAQICIRPKPQEAP